MKQLLIACALTAAATGVHAAGTVSTGSLPPADTLSMSQLFAAMPDTLLPYLTRNNRLDMIDFMTSGMKAEVTNTLDGKSQLTALADDSLTLKLSDACTVDLLLLNTKGDAPDSCRRVIAVVRTLTISNSQLTDTESLHANGSTASADGATDDEGSVMSESEDTEFYTLQWQRLTTAPPLTADDEERLCKHQKTLNIVKMLKEKLNKK